MQDSTAPAVLKYERPPATEAEPFDRLKELLANGYVADAGAPGEAGLLLRHRSAPDLIFHPDGRIEVPIGQPAKGIGARFQLKRWFWALALIVLGGVFWFASLGASLSILEWMENL